MNKLFSHVVILFAAALSLTSCLSDNDESETTYYTDTAISSFSLGTLNITYHTTASDGVTDSTYKSTFSASSYAFDIDQQKGTIATRTRCPWVPMPHIALLRSTPSTVAPCSSC